MSYRPVLPNNRSGFREAEPSSSGLFSTGLDLALSPFRGIEGALQDAYGLVDTVAFDALPDWDERLLGESSTTAGAVSEGIFNFAAGFIPVVGWVGKSAKLGRALGVGKSFDKAIEGARAAGKVGKVAGLNTARGAVAGAITDFAVFDGNEERLSNLIQSNPALANPITEFLAADEDDPEIIGRIKNVLEGAALGAMIDPLVESLSAHRAVRKMRQEGKSAAEIEAALDDRPRSVRAALGYDPDRDLPVTHNGKEPHEWSEGEWKEFGDLHEVENLGPITDIEDMVDPATGNSYQIPGGLEGDFTYLDMLWLKANPADPSTMSVDFQAKLYRKMARSTAPKAGDDLEVFNRTMFGMLSPNQPLTPNELQYVTMRARNKEEIEELAGLISWKVGDEVDPDVRREADRRIARFFNQQSGDQGGLGLKGSADLTNVAEFAQLWLKDPEWFRKADGESWNTYVERTMTQLRGMGAKVASFSGVWQDPVKAAISAVDRHMAARLPVEAIWQNIRKQKTWEKKTVAAFNKEQKAAAAALSTKRGKKIKPIRVKDIDEMMTYEEGDAFFGKALVEEVSKSRDLVKESRRGKPENWKLNPEISDELHEVEFLTELEKLPGNKAGENPKLSVIGPAYRQALAENDRQAQEFGLGLFNSQWAVWDRIRRRNEPHEVMFPGLYKLPRMSQSQLQRSMDAHKSQGFFDSQKEMHTDPVMGTTRLSMKPLRAGEMSEMAYFYDPARGAKSTKQEMELADSYDDAPIGGAQLRRGEVSLEQIKKGASAISERMRLESNVRSLPREDAEVIDSFIERIGPRLFDDVGLSIKERLGPEGQYDYASNVVTIAGRVVRDGAFTRTTLHELWHSLARFLPEEKVAGIEAEFHAARTKAIESDPDLLRRLQSGERLKPDQYRYGSLDEWFAEVMTEKSLAKMELQDEANRSILAHMRLVFGEIITAVKAKFGYGRTQAALDDFFNGRFDTQVRNYGLDSQGVRYMDPASAPRSAFLERMGIDRGVADDILRGVDERLDHPDLPAGVNPRAKDADGNFIYSPEDLLGMRLERQDLNLSRYEDADGALQLIREFEDTFRVVMEEETPGLQRPVSLDQQHTETLEELSGMLHSKNMQTLQAQLMRGIEEDQNALRRLNARVRAYKTLMLTYSKSVKEAADKLALSSATDADSLEFARQMEFLGQLVAGTKGLLSEQGRGLGANRIPTELLDLDTMVRLGDEAAQPEGSTKIPGGNAVDEALQDAGGREAIRKMAEKVRIAYGQGGLSGTAAVTQLTQAGALAKSIGWLNEYFINSILSGLKTMTVNIIGGGMMAMYRPFEHLLGASFNAGFAKMTGETATPFTTEMRRAYLTMAHTLSELTGNMADTFRLSYIAAREGQGRIDPSAPVDDLSKMKAITAQNAGLQDDSIAGRIINAVGNTVRVPSAILSGSDEFIKQVTARGRTRADLTVAAMERGLQGKKAAEWVATTMNELFVDGHGYHLQGLFKRGLALAEQNGLKGVEAKKFAKDWAKKEFDPQLQTLAGPGQAAARGATFTDRLEWKSLPGKYQALVQSHPYLRLVTPFVRTPTNIAYYALQRLFTPVQAAQATVALHPRFSRLKSQGMSLSRDLHSGDPVRQSEAMGRAVASAGFLSFAYGLASSGMLTGRGPSDPEQRALLQASGWLPYSIKLGEGYVQYARLDPFSTMLGTVADTFEYAKWAPIDKQEDIETLLMSSVVAMANNFTNKSYLSGVKAFVDAAAQPDRKMSHLLKQYAAAAVPNVVPQSILGPSQDNMQDVRTILDAVMARTPGLSDDIEPLRNVLGEPVKKIKSAFASETFNITDAFLPIAYRAVEDDLIASELKAVGHGFTPPKTMKGSIDLTEIRSSRGQTAYDRWSQLHGKVRIGRMNLRQALTKVIKSEQYQAMPLETTSEVESPRIRVLRRIIGRYRRAAWSQVMTEYPELREETQRINRLNVLARLGAI